MKGADVVTPGPKRPPDPLHIRKNTQKSKFLLSQAFKWKKYMFFVIPEMPSKTFVMVLKKNFQITLRVKFSIHRRFDQSNLEQLQIGLFIYYPCARCSDSPSNTSTMIRPITPLLCLYISP